MKKFLVIGNPISHSLSPTIHNYWFKNNKIEAVYEKKLVEEKDIEGLIEKVRLNEISGINITVPFKNIVVPQMDHLTTEANITKSVNTVSLEGKKVVGHNTDVAGFELAIRHKKFDITKKKNFNYWCRRCCTIYYLFINENEIGRNICDKQNYRKDRKN